MVTIIGLTTACSGSSSGGLRGPAPATSTSVGPDTQVGTSQTLREPMSKSKATAAEAKLRSLPGVSSVNYDSATRELLVHLDSTITIKQRQKVVVAVGQAANHP